MRFYNHQTTYLKTHRKSKHAGVGYPCDPSLKRHKQYKHEGLGYHCDQCEYAATQLGHLKKHKESKHEGIRYPCDQCE